MANRNPTRKRGISVGSSLSLTLRVRMAAARLIQENIGDLRLPKMFTAVALEGHRTRRFPTRLRCHPFSHLRRADVFEST